MHSGLSVYSFQKNSQCEEYPSSKMVSLSGEQGQGVSRLIFLCLEEVEH